MKFLCIKQNNTWSYSHYQWQKIVGCDYLWACMCLSYLGPVSIHAVNNCRLCCMLNWEEFRTEINTHPLAKDKKSLCSGSVKVSSSLHKSVLTKFEFFITNGISSNISSCFIPTLFKLKRSNMTNNWPILWTKLTRNVNNSLNYSMEYSYDERLHLLGVNSFSAYKSIIFCERRSARNDRIPCEVFKGSKYSRRHRRWNEW